MTTAAAPVKREMNFTALNMNSTPIGPIPFNGYDPATGKVNVPEYFAELCEAACIRLRDGGWGIVSQSSEVREIVRGEVRKRTASSMDKHEKFRMLLDVARVLAMQFLERQGYAGAWKYVRYLNRDDLLRCALGKRDTIRVDENAEVESLTCDVKGLAQIAAGSTQAVFDWLYANSKMEIYTEKKRTFQDNLNIRMPSFAQAKKPMEQAKLDEKENFFD